MKNIVKKINDITLALIITLFNTNVWADLPKPPDSDLASGNKGWLDVGGSMLNKAVNVVCLALAAFILLGVAGGIYKAYHTAQEKGELGHFFRMLIVGLIVAGLAIALIYAARQIIGTKL